MCRASETRYLASHCGRCKIGPLMLKLLSVLFLFSTVIYSLRYWDRFVYTFNYKKPLWVLLGDVQHNLPLLPKSASPLVR